MRHLLQWATMAMAGLAAAPVIADEACEQNAATTSAMIACVSADLQIEDGRLNRLYGELMGLARSHDGGASTGSNGAEQRLRAAQRAWIAFRDADCSLAAYSVQGGSLRPFVQISCLATHTQDRNEQLERLIDVYRPQG